MRFDIITLFPEMFDALTQYGITARAHRKQIWQLQSWNPRSYTHDVHHTVDDRPYGGGPGMVMMAEPLKQAWLDIQHNFSSERKTILLSPCGRPFRQKDAQLLCDQGGAILICGRYEGIDQRFIDHYVDEEYSLGDFVLSGGELPAMVMIDAAVRLMPEVLNTQDSSLQDSFQDGLSGLLDSPHYTRPEVFEDEVVPAVLRSGDHKEIANWRRQQSLRLTATRRPDLIQQAVERHQLTQADLSYLAEISDLV